MLCMWCLKPDFFLFSILYWIFLDSITIIFFLFPIDDVLIICKSIIPNNGLDFYIIKFNTWPAWICLEYWAMQSIDNDQPSHIPIAFHPSCCCSAPLNDLYFDLNDSCIIVDGFIELHPNCCLIKIKWCLLISSDFNHKESVFLPDYSFCWQCWFLQSYS